MPYTLYTPKAAVAMMKSICSKLPNNTPAYSLKLKVHDAIILDYPGTKCSGDYCLKFNEKAFEHREMCTFIVENIYKAANPKAKYDYWMELLSDVYENGTSKCTTLHNEDFLNKSLVFWITLQEQINYPNKMGRLHPFCRYAEAIGSTQTNAYSLNDLYPRINNTGTSPLTFDKLVFPNPPVFYNW